jgi:septal ring factor EnvC (AmiA/AmiB activator)
MAGLTSSAFSYWAGSAWRDRAMTQMSLMSQTDDVGVRLSRAQARLATATDDLATVRQELAAAIRALRRSERDVAQLESRLEELGAEKARVEDERESIRDQRDRLIAVAGLATRAGQELSGCVHRLDGWLAKRPSEVRSSTASDWPEWASAADSVASTCAGAQDTNERLQSAIDG